MDDDVLKYRHLKLHSKSSTGTRLKIYINIRVVKVNAIITHLIKCDYILINHELTMDNRDYLRLTILID